MGRPVTVPPSPQRIISLVPSQTELLADLGLADRVVGITKFCVRPESWYRHKMHIGGTKTIDPEKVKALQPDLIIGSKEENKRDQIENLASQYPVWMSNVTDLHSALAMIRSLGNLTGMSIPAEGVATMVGQLFKDLLQEFSSQRLRCAYFIWKKPWMVAAGQTFIDDMLRYAGFDNVFGHRSRYPEITPEELAATAPQVILLSSEPYPFKEKHREEFLEACPDAQVLLVDGEFFSWYGSRLLLAPAYFRKLRYSL